MSIYNKYPCVSYIYYNDFNELIVVVYDETSEEDKQEILAENKEVLKILTKSEDRFIRY